MLINFYNNNNKCFKIIYKNNNNYQKILQIKII